MIPDEVSPSLSELRHTYQHLRASQLSREALSTRLRDEKLRHAIERLQRNLLVLVGHHDIEATTQVLELLVAVLAVVPSSDQESMFADLSGGLIGLLREKTPESHEAASRLIAFLLVAIGALPTVRDDLRFLLGSLTGRQEGNLKRIERIHEVSTRSLPRISQLLDVGLANEVVTFLDVLDRMPAERTHVIPGQSSAVGCMVSRKGGVGKSTLTLALALASEEFSKDERICVFDFDLSGPMWQYSLLPDGSDLRGKAAAEMNLNLLINFDQPDDEFQFGIPNAEKVLNVCLKAHIPSIKREVGLLSWADRPRTNRFIARAIGNNPKSFRGFLDSVIRALSTEYSLILIDNSPGFDFHTQIAYQCTAGLERGCPIIVSSPFVADLRGSMLEVSDLRFLDPKARPLWVINKVVEKSLAEDPINALLLAERMPAYRSIIPDAPLLKRVIPVHTLAANVTSLPFDRSLAERADWMDAGCWSADGVKGFNQSKFFLRLMEKLKSLPAPVPFWDM
jgi:hypothetical protein